jgi:hypothetical protein
MQEDEELKELKNGEFNTTGVLTPTLDSLTV